MRRYAISGLALALALFGGCTNTTTQARLDPDVGTVVPARRHVCFALDDRRRAVFARIRTSGRRSEHDRGGDSGGDERGTGIRLDARPGTWSHNRGARGGHDDRGAGGGATTAVPAPALVTTIPGVMQTLKAEDIQTQRLRANTIYANRIKAGEIHGVIHQDTGLKVADTRGEIKAPEVVFSVIIADEIKANSVVADHIYVRDLRRR